MIKRIISLDNVISSRILDNGWRDMTKEERVNALNEIKDFLKSTCRGTNTETYRAINRMSINNLPESMGIFNRLTTDGYCAGQDYPSELKFIKEQIKKYC